MFKQMGERFRPEQFFKAPEPDKSSETLKIDKEKVAEFMDLQVENAKEFEKWQKNLKEVIGAMKRKRDGLQQVVTAMHQKRAGLTDIRTLVIVLGGGMQGAYAAGQLRAL